MSAVTFVPWDVRCLESDQVDSSALCLLVRSLLLKYKWIAVVSNAILKEMTQAEAKSPENRVVDKPEYHFCGHCNQHLALKTFRRHEEGMLRVIVG